MVQDMLLGQQRLGPLQVQHSQGEGEGVMILTQLEQVEVKTLLL